MSFNRPNCPRTHGCISFIMTYRQLGRPTNGPTAIYAVTSTSNATAYSYAYYISSRPLSLSLDCLLSPSLLPNFTLLPPLLCYFLVMSMVLRTFIVWKLLPLPWRCYSSSKQLCSAQLIWFVTWGPIRKTTRWSLVVDTLFLIVLQNVLRTQSFMQIILTGLGTIFLGRDCSFAIAACLLVEGEVKNSMILWKE